MTQDSDTQEPRPRALVFRKPGSWRLVQPPHDYEERAPYPRWFTIPARGTLTGVEIAAAVYIGWYQQGMENAGKNSNAEIALAGVGIAAAIDGLITILSIIGLYESGASCTAGFIDVIPAVISCVGAIGVAWRERRGDDDPWVGPQHTSATFAGVVAALHFICSIGGCVGCCLTCSRMKSAKAAKVAARNADAGSAADFTAALSDLPFSGPQNGEQDQQLPSCYQRQGRGVPDGGIHPGEADTKSINGQAGKPEKPAEEP